MSPDRSELDSLTKSALNGEQEAWAALYRCLAPKLVRTIKRKFPRLEAEDVVQDAFVKALAELATLRDMGKVEPWLHKIAYHTALGMCQKSHPRSSVPLTRSMAPERTVGWTRVLATEFRELLDIALEVFLEGQQKEAVRDWLNDEKHRKGSRAARESYGQINRALLRMAPGVVLAACLPHGRPRQESLFNTWFPRLIGAVTKELITHADDILKSLPRPGASEPELLEGFVGLWPRVHRTLDDLLRLPCRVDSLQRAYSCFFIWFLAVRLFRNAFRPAWEATIASFSDPLFGWNQYLWRDIYMLGRYVYDDDSYGKCGIPCNERLLQSIELARLVALPSKHTEQAVNDHLQLLSTTPPAAVLGGVKHMGCILKYSRYTIGERRYNSQPLIQASLMWQSGALNLARERRILLPSTELTETERQLDRYEKKILRCDAGKEIEKSRASIRRYREWLDQLA